MALAEKLHHSSRGQRFARAGEDGHEEHDALRRQRPPPPQPELFQLFEEEPGGSRPPCLGEPRGPQEKVAHRRRTHGADSGHSWVAGGWSGGEGAAEARRAGCRAGHRSALDLL